MRRRENSRRFIVANARAQFGDSACPVRAARDVLAAKAARIIAHVTHQVAIARDKRGVGSLSKLVQVHELRDCACCPKPDMMIHEVVPQLS